MKGLAKAVIRAEAENGRRDPNGAGDVAMPSAEICANLKVQVKSKRGGWREHVRESLFELEAVSEELEDERRSAVLGEGYWASRWDCGVGTC